MKYIITAIISSCLLVAGANAEVKIGGNNTQKVTVGNGLIANTAVGAASKAKQNVASNKGDVKIGGNNNQEVTVGNGLIANTAVGAASVAEQNLASNAGD